MKGSLSDFVVGVVNVLVVFLPGSLLLGFLLWLVPESWLASQLLTGQFFSSLIAVSASYVLGHMISLAGSYAEDKYILHSSALQYPELYASVRLIIEEILPGTTENHEKPLRRQAALVLKQLGSPCYSDVEQKDADRRLVRNMLVVFIVVMSILLLCITDLYLRDINLFVFKDDLGISECIWAAILTGMFLGPAAVRFFDLDKKYTRKVFESLLVATSPFVHKFQDDAGPSRE